LIYAMRDGQYQDLASAVLGFQGIPMPSAMTFMMDCSSGASGDRLGRIQREAEETLLGDVLNIPFPDVCPAWGNPALGSDFYEPLQSEIPTLVVSGTLDGRTPPRNGEEILEGLSDGVHLILQNGGHDSLDDWFYIPAYREAVVAFMKEQPLQQTHINLPFEFEQP
jgi:pimeloyl-ACP methyl ester carboxylesterase